MPGRSSEVQREQRARRRRAFTLIELLVVVAIIALLISILLPSMAKAREQAKRVQCAAHMHQIGIGLSSYATDAKQRLPMRGGYTYNLKEPFAYFWPSSMRTPDHQTLRYPVGIGQLYPKYCGGEGAFYYCPANLTYLYDNTWYGFKPYRSASRKTTTSPRGRDAANEGYPIRVCELLATLEAPVYIERVALTDAKHIAQTRRAVRKALQVQAEGKGFSLVEVLSACPSGWKMAPTQAVRWIEEQLMNCFPLGVYRDRTAELPATPPGPREFVVENLAELLEIPVGPSATAGDLVLPAARYRNPRLKIAGFGGQGILLLGLVLAEAGMRAGYNVSWIPSYGPEMRGGTANCHVNLSTLRVGSPVVSVPTVLIAMNLPSLDRFESEVQPGGLIIYDSSLIERSVQRSDVEAFPLPATKMADELGNTRVANMVALGAYVGLTGILSEKQVLTTLPETIKRKELLAINEKAVQTGFQYAREFRRGS